MNDRTISRGQEILRRVRCYKNRRTIGVASAFATLCLIIIACHEIRNGECIRG